MLRSTKDRLTLNLIARSTRAQPDWLDALPDWRDHVYPEMTLVDALVEAKVLHAPAIQIIDLTAAGTLKIDHVPVLLTHWGCERLNRLLSDYATGESVDSTKPVDYDRFGNGDFILLGSETDAEDDATRYDDIGAGEFIAFVDTADGDDGDADDAVSDEVSADPDRKSVVNAAHPDWDRFDSGDFISFDTTT